VIDVQVVRQVFQDAGDPFDAAPDNFVRFQRPIARTSEQIQDSSTESRRMANGNLGAVQNAPTGTLRKFVRSLSLRNMSERIAAIAYYVNKIEKRPSFSPKEMDGWFTMCGMQKPSQMSLALFDAKRKYGYMESPSRGVWKVSNQGENLIIRKVEESHEAS
jgi:hypothetical protein